MKTYLPLLLIAFLTGVFAADKTPLIRTVSALEKKVKPDAMNPRWNRIRSFWRKRLNRSKSVKAVGGALVMFANYIERRNLKMSWDDFREWRGQCKRAKTDAELIRLTAALERGIKTSAPKKDAGAPQGAAAVQKVPKKKNRTAAAEKPADTVVPYPGQAWRPLRVQKFAARPPLLSKETLFDYYQGCAYAIKSGHVYWAARYGRGKYGLLRWHLKTGQSERVLPMKDMVRGLAYHAESDLLVLRKHNRLEFYDNRSLRLKRKAPFAHCKYWWKDMAALKDHLIVVEDDSRYLARYDLRSLKRTDRFRCEKGKVQRIFRADTDRVWLWSSYWGNRLYRFDFPLGKITFDTQAAVPHRGFWQAAFMGPGQMGVFHHKHNQFNRLRRIGRMWIDTVRDVQSLPGRLAYRYAPKVQELSGVFSVRPKRALSAQSAVFALPVKESPGQRVSAERFPAGGKTFSDPLGNRYLSLDIPALPAGRLYEKTYYRARLTRYKVLFSLAKIPMGATLSGQYDKYRKDDKIYGLGHPLLEKTYRQRFAHLKGTEQIQAVYEFAVQEIKGVWDNRSDDAPTVLKNRHGGCTEHSYVQIALLRKGGLPARFNWNWLPTQKDPRPRFNHKFAEVFLPACGWIPLEPLAGTRTMAGELSNYHIIFAVRPAYWNEFFYKKDVLAFYTGPDKWRAWKNAYIDLKWELR